MKVFCYYTATPKLPVFEEVGLQHCWADAWSAIGFEPIVLTEFHAQRHPKFGHLLPSLEKLPSVNPDFYDRACFLRWIAMAYAPVAKSELFLMTDYDLLGYESAPFLHYGSKAKPDFKRLVSFQGHVPCCVLGTRELFLQQAERFARYQVRPEDVHDGTPHVSDMTILAHQSGAEPESYVRLDLVKGYSEAGWETAPAVHFSNSVMTKLLPRSKNVRKLRPFNTENV